MPGDNGAPPPLGGPRPIPPGEADARLYAYLVADDFKGSIFDVVADHLIRYAYPTLRAWIASGQIVSKCARLRVRVAKGLAAGGVYLSAADVEDLAGETVSLALHSLVESGRAGRGWAAEGGSTLATYFLGRCLLEFGEVYRSWAHRGRRRQDVETASAEAAQEVRRGREPDPGDVVAARDALARQLPGEPRVRTAVLLEAAGYTYAEIAEVLGDGTTTRAVEGLIHRYHSHTEGGGTT